MLVLSRKVNERIICTAPSGEQVKVMVVGVYGDKVKLGIDAPRDVTIYREEIQRRVDAEHPELRRVGT